jgi:hypothetical protein
VEEPRFLPPEPPDAEPELSARPAPAETAAEPQAPQQQTYGYPPPAPGQAPGYPPPGYGAYQQPPPAGYGGYQAPPPGWGHPPQWAWQGPVPDNGQAVVGFVFSLVGVGLLVISFGLSSVVSLGCAITGIVCSRNGKRKVERGESPKHKGLAQAGFIIGWVGVALSILATAGWILAFVLGIDTSSDSGSPGQIHIAALLALRG